MFDLFRAPVWLPFGSLVAPVGSLLAPFGSFVSFWYPFGSLWVSFAWWIPYGSLLAPLGSHLAPFVFLLAPFGFPLALFVLWLPSGSGFLGRVLASIWLCRDYVMRGRSDISTTLVIRHTYTYAAKLKKRYDLIGPSSRD